MPTHEELPLFLREWKKLSQEEQVLFLAAVEEMVEDLRAHIAFRPSLRVKGV
jgi:mRNA-degrading endonuclease RelE of RelBE toxin-antitoxin system